MPPFENRRDAVLSTVLRDGLTGALITNPINVTYLTGFSGEASYLAMSAERVVLISDGRFVGQIAEECPGIDLHVRPPSQTLADAAAEVLGKLGLSSIGFESNHLTVADFETLRDKSGPIDWKGGTNRVESLRAIKDAGELARIREAIAIAEGAFGRFLRDVRAERTEKELHDAMEFHVRSLGGKTTAFPTIVAVGDRAALPHASPTSRRIGEAPFVLVDWGASEAFYKSDLTRVLWTDKSNSNSGLRDEFLRVVEVVRRAQRAAIERVRVGAVLGDIDAAARRTIADAGYGEFFTHSIGHGFGLQIHEAPFLRPGAAGTLEAGMVITIEPGIYIPGRIGVRLEDDVLVTRDGPVVLTGVSIDPDAWRGFLAS